MKKKYYVIGIIIIILIGVISFGIMRSGMVQDPYQTFTHNISTPTVLMNLDCPTGYISVPGDVELGTKDFCVAKYEMKIVGEDDGDVEYVANFSPESRASGTPWKNTNQVQAKEECQSIGEGYDLISNEEWMSISYNIESVASNWSDNQTHPVGTTSARINMGHTCRKGIMGKDCRTAWTKETQHGIAFSGEGLAASENDNEACFGYVKGDYEIEKPICNSTTWSLFRRTHLLNNGEVIWDFSGNVWDWVDWTVSKASDRARKGGVINGDFLEINEAEPTILMPKNSFQSKNNQLLSSSMNGNGLGRYHPTAEDDGGAAMRGGNYMQGEYNNGIYGIGMGYSPDSDHLLCEIGFRCVYRPLN